MVAECLDRERETIEQWIDERRSMLVGASDERARLARLIAALSARLAGADDDAQAELAEQLRHLRARQRQLVARSARLFGALDEGVSQLIEIGAFDDGEVCDD